MFFNNLHLSIEWANRDIINRYTRSVLGPFWITISLTIFIIIISQINSRIFGANLEEVTLFLAAGFIVWYFISGIVSESHKAFIDHSELMLEMSISKEIFVYKVIVRNLIVLSHNCIVLIPIYVFYEIKVGWGILLAIPGLIILTFALFGLALILSLLGSKYRDVEQINVSILQAVFFSSPILWMPRLLPDDSPILLYNPITYFLDVTRGPLIGAHPDALSFLVCICVALALNIVGCLLFQWKSKFITYWL